MATHLAHLTLNRATVIRIRVKVMRIRTRLRVRVSRLGLRCQVRVWIIGLMLGYGSDVWLGFRVRLGGSADVVVVYLFRQ